MGKFRSSFVTNSSSSSFICEVSGQVEAGYDMGLEDAGMYECQNGHTFCENYLVGELGSYTKDEMISILDGRIKNRESQYEKNQKDYILNCIKEDKENLKELEETPEDNIESFVKNLADEMGLNDRYSIPAINCPICTMNEITDSDEVKYLLKKVDMSSADVKKEIKDKFKTFDEFKNALK